MASKNKILIWLVPVCLTASVAASLAAAWIVSKLAGFHFDPPSIVVASIAACLTAITVIWRKKS